MSFFLVGSGVTSNIEDVCARFVAEAKNFGTKLAVVSVYPPAQNEAESAAEPSADGFVLPSSADAERLLDTDLHFLKQLWPEADLVLVDPKVSLTQNQQLASEGATEPTDKESSDVTVSDCFDGVAGIIVCGGYVPAYLAALAPHRGKIAALTAAGVPYLGFSAGAHVVGKLAVCGGWQYQSRQLCPESAGEGFTELNVVDGLGLVSVTVTAHTDSWHTLPVAMAAVEANDQLTVAAIDEDTCLRINEVTGRTRVMGKGRVHWVSRQADVFLVRWEDKNSNTRRQDFRRKANYHS